MREVSQERLKLQTLFDLHISRRVLILLSFSSGILSWNATVFDEDPQENDKGGWALCLMCRHWYTKLS